MFASSNAGLINNYFKAGVSNQNIFQVSLKKLKFFKCKVKSKKMKSTKRYQWKHKFYFNLKTFNDF